MSKVHITGLVGKLSAVEGTPNGQPIEVIRTGTFNHPAVGQFDVTEEMIDQMVENFTQYFGTGRIPIDYNHASLNDEPSQATAAGWIVNLYKEEHTDPDRLSLMAEVEWTDTAKDYIGNDEYRYISAEMAFNYSHPEVDEPIGTTLLAAALTNRPFIPDMNPVALSNPTLDALKMDREIRCNLPESLIERLSHLRSAFYAAFPDGPNHVYWVTDVTEDNLIVEQWGGDGTANFRVGYSYNTGEDSYDFDSRDAWAEVQQVWVDLSAPAQIEGAKGKLKVDPNAGNGRFSAPAGQVAANTNDTQSTDGQKPSTQEEPKMDKLLEFLGLENEADILASIKALKEKADRVDQLEADLTASTGEVEALKASQAGDETEKDERIAKLTTLVEAGEEQNRVLVERLDNLESAEKERKAKALIASAIKAGKMAPVEAKDKEDGTQKPMVKLAYENPESFSEIIENRPATYADLLTEEGKEDEKVHANSADATESKYWEEVNNVMDEHEAKGVQLTQSEARELVKKEHPELAPKFV